MSEETKSSEIHVYDDIEEHDNPIPEWFALFFYGGVLFGLAYFCYFELWGGSSLRAEYDRAVTRNELIRLELKSKTPKTGTEALYALSRDPVAGKNGGDLYRSQCVACHGAEAQGGIGPNLVDAYWIHGGKVTEVRDTVEAGVPAKGMPPWGGIFSAEEVDSVAAYLYSLRGTRPPGGKAPQGELFKE